MAHLYSQGTRLFSALAVFLVLLCPSLNSQDDTSALARQELALLSGSDAVILGVVEGVTEFLPISSTGHLIIANHMLDLESDEILKDPNGNPLWNKKPSEKHPKGEPMTVKLAADTYVVIIQIGAIMAVVLLYHRRLLSLVMGVLGRDNDGLHLLRNILCACIPVGAIGLLLHDFIEEELFSVQAVIVAQISGAVLMIAAERWRKQRTSTDAGIKEPSDLTILESAAIGLMQCFALWPGMSRSMVTIVGGYFTGLRPAKAAEFSFLVGLPVLAGAAFIKSVKSGAAMVTVFGWDHILLGIVIAAISAALAVKFLVSFLSRHGLFAFAIYRLLLACALGWMLLS